MHFTNQINQQYGININIKKVVVNIFSGVKLKNVLIRDYRNDTLIYVKILNTNILEYKKIIKGDLYLGKLRIDKALINIKNYKGEKDSNLDKFIEAFEDGKTSQQQFLMKINKVFIYNSRFIMTDENSLIPKDLDVKKLNSEFENFKILGSNVKIEIKKLSFLDHHGVFVKQLSTNFAYTKKNIILQNLNIETENSQLNGSIKMLYDKDRKDFSDFKNKVIFDVKIDKASIGTNDIYHFYNDIGKNKNIIFHSNIKGSLNNLFFSNLNLKDDKSLQIIGNMNLKNLFDQKGERFYMKGNFKRITSNYYNLISLLPNILNKNISSSFKKLGDFKIEGDIETSTNYINTNVFITTALGDLKTNLKMTNISNIDNATYKGNIILNQFNIGSLLDNKDLGKINMNIDVDGRGFSQKYLNTTVKGDIYKVFYNGYNYTNIQLDGNFRKPFFRGKLTVKDPNLLISFDGTVDMTDKINHYDFNTRIDFADFRKLNFIKDSISKFKGDIKINASGNYFDNLVGSFKLSNASYSNKKNTYQFNDFEIQSTFDNNNLRTISIESPDIVQGKIIGQYQFASLKKIFENSLGSLYANYKPNKIKKGQFLKFDLKIYNKIIEIFYPEVEIGSNTILKGSITSDNNDFKFNFNSPKIKAFENSFDNINIKIDNKNQLFNTYIEIDSIITKHYSMRDFSLINVTHKDTLYLRSEFKGGSKGEDLFNLNLFHTINKENKNVVGFKKSDIKFKNNLWFINEMKNDDNKIIFDKSFKDFNIKNLILSRGNEQAKINGIINGKSTKDLSITFKDVQLEEITSTLEKFKFGGLLNGVINLKQQNSIYQPTASLKVSDLKINDDFLGNLNLDINGDDTLKNFSINSSITNENIKAFNATGKLQVQDSQTTIDLNLDFNNLNLSLLSGVGGSAISNIKGFATGNAKINGSIDDFDINGSVTLVDAGLKIPYLNTEYLFVNKPVIDISRTKFTLNNITLKDIKYKTNAVLSGNILHKNFSDWQLDLNIVSKNMVAMDIQDSEDAVYFGTAFINGKASIVGSVDALTINVDAKSNKGTDIKIPVNDSEGERDDNYIHFVTVKEKENITKGIVVEKNYDGLTLNFNLDITPDASVEVILSRESKHGIKATGYGTLQLSINTLGKFVMNGDYRIWNGSYNFKYGGLIDKTFEIKRGGTIIWSGDPLKAELNIEAIYNKLNANPGVLLENPSFNKQVPVSLTIGVTGNLSNPETNFDIDFPTVSTVLKSEIQSKLEDKQVRQKQALILLGSGSFLSQEGLNQSSLAFNNLFEKAGHLFDDLFQDEDSKIKMGIIYNQADKNTAGTPTNGRVDVNFSTQVNAKVTINGKVGVPVGGVNETAIVGNVEVQYRVNEDGTMNLKFYNRENEINYIGEGIGYTQGFGISYDVDFDLFSELVKKIFNKKIKIVPESDEPIKDKKTNEIAPSDYTNPNDDKKKNN